MEEPTKYVPSDQQISREATQLTAVLKEMKQGLDTVRNKILALTTKVKAGDLPTTDGLSYLEAKHVLLLNYCQSLVYYLLRKANGSSIQEHPVVKSLVEIRLFLEKIRPIDKKLNYQIEKMTRDAGNKADTPDTVEKGEDKSNDVEDLTKYRPHPELLVSKSNADSEDRLGVYRPPKFAPSSMEDKMSKVERNALRKEKVMMREATQSAYVRDLMNDLEGRPEEVREQFGSESREMVNYISKMEEGARQEEEHFTRAPLNKFEKKKMKHLMKSRNGLQGLTESFYDEIKALPIAGEDEDRSVGFKAPSTGDKKLKKRKRKH